MLRSLWAVLIATSWLCSGCSSNGVAERSQPAAAPAANGGSQSPPPPPPAAAGGFGAPQLDAGVVPVTDACAGGCAEPDPRVSDDDGFTVADGDCNDFAPLVNPGAYDVPNNGIDDDCDGADAKTESCDDALELAATDPLMAARAIELCRVSDESSKRWGVVGARWTTPDGAGKPGDPSMHGLLPGFGAVFAPRAGKRLLAISSGVARAPGQAGYTRDCSDYFPVDSTDLPKGFDGTSSSCEIEDAVTTVVDAIALELRVRMPTNVSALSFDSAFFTDEYPAYICTPFNDFFQVIVQPLRAGGTPDGNVVFDRDDNAVSVNNSLLGVCAPGRHGDKDFACPQGFEPLAGTGFEDCAFSLVTPSGFSGIFARDQKYGASTGWLHTEFAVQPGEIVTLRFSIWDSGDSALDSLAIIDHVRFRLRDAPPPPDKPKTEPVGPQ